MSPARFFFPQTCHSPLTRRRFLVGGSAAFALGGLGGRPVFARSTSDEGAAIIKRYASAPDEPWVVAHGIRGMGRQFTIAGGRRAVDYLLEDVLVSVPVNGKEWLAFPVDVEGHSNMFLKTMLEAGVPLEHTFTHRGRRRTLHDVVDGAHGLFRPKLVQAVPNNLPWSIIALTRTTPTLRKQWTNAWGEPVDLDQVVEGALQLLEQASMPVAEAMRAGRSEATSAPVHSFTCGGTHMIYGLLTAVHAGYGGSNRRERIQQQVDLLVWRLRADLDLMERFYAGRAGNPMAPLYELDAKLKLIGHGEECLAFASRHDVVSFTASQREQRQVAVATLRKLLRDLEASNLTPVKTSDRELYQQLIGDTCHARHGLTLT